jgi:hypothetical protein
MTKYVVTFTNDAGERREAVTELTEEEQRDCAWQAMRHGQPNWPPLENRYAACRAAALVPAEFAQKVPTVERVDLH